MTPAVLRQAGYVTSAIGKWGQLPLGPAEFGFDEHLKPQVRDASGALLKDLPSPLKSDDAALAEAAVARWKASTTASRRLSTWSF